MGYGALNENTVSYYHAFPLVRPRKGDFRVQGDYSDKDIVGNPFSRLLSCLAFFVVPLRFSPTCFMLISRKKTLRGFS